MSLQLRVIWVLKQLLDCQLEALVLLEVGLLVLLELVLFLLDFLELSLLSLSSRLVLDHVGSLTFVTYTKY